MNKILLCLCATLVGLFFLACEKKLNDEPRYLDNKLIEGVWSCKFSSDSLVYYFVKGQATYDFYAHIQGLDTLKLDREYLGKYMLTDSNIIFSEANNRNLNYKLDRNNYLFVKRTNNKDFWLRLEKIK